MRERERERDCVWVLGLTQNGVSESPSKAVRDSLSVRERERERERDLERDYQI